jgi:hypothetical protein
MLASLSEDRYVVEEALQFSTIDAFTAHPSVVAGVVAEVLGDRLACYIAGVTDARTLAQWRRWDVPDGAAQRLQGALRIILQLRQRYSDREPIAVWFTWLSELLDDRSPASVLHGAAPTRVDIENATRTVLAAARAFLREE